MKINIGDYVRTKDGKIFKWNKVCILKQETSEEYLKEHTRFSVIDEKDIKSSPNIIDLIEVGDYVNGNKIVHIQEEQFPEYPKRLLFAGVDENNIDDVWEVYNNERIKSIVTKEQFESMEYKIGE